MELGVHCVFWKVWLLSCWYLLLGCGWRFRWFFHYSFSVYLLSNYSASRQMHLSGQTCFRLKANSWPVSLPPPEIFLAGLSVATTPCDSVIAFLPARGRSRALHKQAVRAVWIRAGGKDNNKLRRMARPRWFVWTRFNGVSHTMSTVLSVLQNAVLTGPTL